MQKDMLIFVKSYSCPKSLYDHGLKEMFYKIGIIMFMYTATEGSIFRSGFSPC